MPARLVVQWPELQWRAAGTVPFMANADGARRDAKAITDGWGEWGLGENLGGGGGGNELVRERAVRESGWGKSVIKKRNRDEQEVELRENCRGDARSLVGQKKRG